MPEGQRGKEKVGRYQKGAGSICLSVSLSPTELLVTGTRKLPQMREAGDPEDGWRAPELGDP